MAWLSWCQRYTEPPPTLKERAWCTHSCAEWEDALVAFAGLHALITSGKPNA